MTASTSTTDMNVLFMGNFLYPQGMAATKLIQHDIDGLRACGVENVAVLLLRQAHQGRQHDALTGVHEGVPYHTVGVDLAADLNLPVKWFRYVVEGILYIRQRRREQGRPVLYVYGALSLENLPFVISARLIGYEVYFNITEDVALSAGPAPHAMSRIKAYSCRLLARYTASFAAGIFVISGHLKRKYEKLAAARFPIYLKPVSIYTRHFPAKPKKYDGETSFLYAGSFGAKDAVELLISAFAEVSARRRNVVLKLAGTGVETRMRSIQACIDASPAKDRIILLGYVPDTDYYKLIACSHVLCAIRSDSDFANAGFPFKLGEFLGTGNPVITARVSDVEKYLRDRENALLVRPGSLEDVAQAMTWLLDRPGEARRIGQAGRRLAIEQFDHIAQGRQLYEAFCTAS